MDNLTGNANPDNSDELKRALRAVGVETDLKHASSIKTDALSSIFDLSRPKPRKIARKRYGRSQLKRLLGLGSRYVAVLHLNGGAIAVPIGNSDEDAQAVVLSSVGLRHIGLALETHFHGSPSTTAQIERALLAQELHAARPGGRA